MVKSKLEEVFGVSSQPVLSYVEREDVDNRFTDALKSDKQIVIYGSSKQGKTALVSKYISYKDNILISLSPKHSLSDIYSSILRQTDIKIETEKVNTSGKEIKVGIVAKFKALIPIFGGIETEGNTDSSISSETEVTYESVSFNLELPQDISEILKKINFKKFIILENFHYLNDELQLQFAFDLRTFQELGIRFIILGVWREKNKMAQFNGDLLDRIIEVPVEPWHLSDFEKVVSKGSEILNIVFEENLINQCKLASFKSIGVFQEILKEICFNANILEYQSKLITISDDTYLQKAIQKKAEEYSARHRRALEAIASGNSPSQATPQSALQHLFLPYYLVKSILESGYDGLDNGMPRSVLQTKIQSTHHRKEDVRPGDMSNLLYNLAKLQSKKSISPPIIDFDRNTNKLQVVDSTFYFFLKHADLPAILEELPNPLESSEEII